MTETLIIICAVALVVLGIGYLTRPTCYHCRWCGIYWREGSPCSAPDHAGVAKEALCPGCQWRHNHALESFNAYQIASMEELIRTMPNDPLAKPLAESRLAELKKGQTP